VERPEEIRGAIDWAIRTSNEKRVPVLVEIMTERRANAAMGTSIDNIREFEPMEQHEAIEGGVMAEAG
jgi:tartronate-semialdehyde synthase